MLTIAVRIALLFGIIFSYVDLAHSDEYDDRARSEQVAKMMQQIDDAKMDAARNQLSARKPLSSEERDAQTDRYNNKLMWFLIAVGSVFALYIFLARTTAQAKELLPADCAKAKTPEARKGTTADELEKLAKLRDSGLLSEDEFLQEKSKLLGSS